MPQSDQDIRTVPIIPDATVRSLLTPRKAMDVISAVYADYGRARRVLSDPPAMLMPPVKEGQAAFKIKGAHVPSQGISGFRMIADVDTGEREISQDYCWIADAQTGHLKGIVEENALHRLRTAMTGVVALQWLARPESRVATIIGAGAIADELPAGLREAFQLDEIRIVSRRLSSAQQFAARHGSGGRVTAVEKVDDAVEGTDIVVTITNAAEPVLFARHLSRGIAVCGLGGGPELAADIVTRADRIVVDDLAYAKTIGSVRGWISAGLGEAALKQRFSADIGEIALDNRRGRQSPGDIVVAVIQGMACCDVALASYALETWRTRSLAS